jgi:hypothetical protein
MGGSKGSNDGFDHHGTRRGERLVEDRAAPRGVIDGEAGGPARAGEGREVDGLEVHAEFRIAQKHHLLPLDHPEGVVLDDDDLDGQAVLHGGGELRHQHRKATITHERDDLALGARHRRGDGIGKCSIGRTG